MSIHPLTVGGSWLTEQGEAHIVLAQVAPASIEILTTGAARPWVVETVRDLLGVEQRLGQIVTGDKPAILVLPELALGFDDWPKIDELVRTWNRSLIVISGFGFTRGDSLNAWLGRNGPTKRLAAWPNDNGPANERVYNGGWCWIHRPGATTCVTFLKVTAEQHDEIHIGGLDQGTLSLSIRLDDLIIFPVICSDLLSVVGGQRVIQRKIVRDLEEHANDARRVLVIGLLLQKTSHEKWRTAILDVARNINSERVNVCLINSANDICSMIEDNDRWRDYSGVYIATGRRAYREQFAAVRRFSSEQIDGAVIRATSALVLGGPLRWTFDGATGRHLWAVKKDYGVSDQGKLVGSPCTDCFRFETLRMLKRLTEAHDAPAASKLNLARASYAAVEAQIRSDTLPAAETICQKLLFGESGREARERLNADTLSDFIPQSSEGLKVLGALKSDAGMAWQADPKQKGQLHLQDRGVNVLVWCYPGSHIRMRQTLQEWRSELTPNPPLVVFKKATGTLYAAPDETSERRRDIGQAPTAKGRAADEPTPTAQVVEQNLDEIEDCFETEVAAELAAAVNARILAAVGALFGEGDEHAA
jgi:hypothetical protein